MGNNGSALVGRDVCCGVAAQSKSVTTDPGFLKKSATVPKVLEDFLEARRVGDVDAAAVCCTEDMTMRGPMGEFAGLEIVKTKAFSKPSQPLGKMLMLLQYQASLSTATDAVYAREFEAQIGYAQVPLRQEVRAPARRRVHRPTRDVRRATPRLGALCSAASTHLVLTAVRVACLAPRRSSPCATRPRRTRVSAWSSFRSLACEGDREDGPLLEKAVATPCRSSPVSRTVPTHAWRSISIRTRSRTQLVRVKNVGACG